MDMVIYLFLGFYLALSVAGGVVKPQSATCPADHQRRVETCIMEAQVAPQAGGGIALVVNNSTLEDLCDRGMLQKSIDCLEEIHARCAQNITTLHELDRLYSVDNWKQGAQLLCQNTELFQENWDCLSRCASSVMTCVLMRTHTFRMGLSFANPSDHAMVRRVTCNFAESIVKCVRSPLRQHCPPLLVKRLAQALHLFLPPFCLADNYITFTQPPTHTASTHYGTGTADTTEHTDPSQYTTQTGHSQHTDPSQYTTQTGHSQHTDPSQYTTQTGHSQHTDPSQYTTQTGHSQHADHAQQPDYTGRAQQISHSDLGKGSSVTDPRKVENADHGQQPDPAGIPPNLDPRDRTQDTIHADNSQHSDHTESSEKFEPTALGEKMESSTTGDTDHSDHPDRAFTNVYTEHTQH